MLPSAPSVIRVCRRRTRGNRSTSSLTRTSPLRVTLSNDTVSRPSRARNPYRSGGVLGPHAVSARDNAASRVTTRAQETCMFSPQRHEVMFYYTALSLSRKIGLCKNVKGHAAHHSHNSFRPSQCRTSCGILADSSPQLLRPRLPCCCNTLPPTTPPLRRSRIAMPRSRQQ